MAGNITEVIKVTTVGVLATSTAASVDVALPVGSTGALVKFYRFSVVQNATGFAVHVKVGPAGGVATTGDLMVTANDAVILDCGGCTNFQHIQEVAAANLQVSPVEGG